MKESKTKKVVLVGGCFDILHYGHIYFLKKAKELGNYLIVALESDAGVRKLKGKGRPFHSQNQRREILESLKFVDQVIILKDMMKDTDYERLVKLVSPGIIAITKGDKMAKRKKSLAKKVGARIVEISYLQTYSTTKAAKALNPE